MQGLGFREQGLGFRDLGTYTYDMSQAGARNDNKTKHDHYEIHSVHECHGHVDMSS